MAPRRPGPGFRLLLLLAVLGGRARAARVHAHVDELYKSTGQRLNGSAGAAAGGDAGWWWGEDDPMDVALGFIADNTTYALEQTVVIGDVNVTLKFKKTGGQGQASLLVYSNAAGGKPPAKCMDLQLTPAGPERASEINAAWIGTMGSDFKDGNPCLLDFAAMSAWLEKLVHWNTKSQEYELWTITDAAAGRCRYRSPSGGVTMWQGTQVILTPLSLLKYGMPFYTLKGGLFPLNVLNRDAKAKREFCAKTLAARELGQASLESLIGELMPVAAGGLRSVAGRMNKGVGPAPGATLKDLLQDKSVWIDVQDTEGDCRDTTNVLKLLGSWRCRHFENQTSSEAKACRKHAQTVRYITRLGKSYGRWIVNETKNEELICPWYDFTWKAKFYYRPKFWEAWAKAGRFFSFRF